MMNLRLGDNVVVADAVAVGDVVYFDRTGRREVTVRKYLASIGGSEAKELYRVDGHVDASGVRTVRFVALKRPESQAANGSEHGRKPVP